MSKEQRIIEAMEQQVVKSYKLTRKINVEDIEVAFQEGCSTCYLNKACDKCKANAFMEKIMKLSTT